MTAPRPTFRDAYLVELDDKPIGFVRRDRVVWRIFRLGVADTVQPIEAFATREEAGQRLVELAAD